MKKILTYILLSVFIFAHSGINTIVKAEQKASTNNTQVQDTATDEVFKGRAEVTDKLE